MARKHLTMDNHKDDCVDPHVIRLYGKKYRYEPYCLTCTSCDAFQKTNFDPKFKSRIAKMSREYIPEENIDRIVKANEAWYGRKFTIEQILKRNRAEAIINKCRRQEREQRKLLGESPITPEEQGLKKRIRNLETFYEKASSQLNTDLGWDRELLRRFLLCRPTIKELESLLNIGWLRRPQLLFHESRGERRLWTRARFLEALMYCCKNNNEKEKENLAKALKADIQTRKEFMEMLLNPEPKREPEPETKEEEKEVITITTSNSKRRKKKLY